MRDRCPSAILKATDDFIAIPFDPHGEMELKSDLKACVPPKRLKMLADSGHVPANEGEVIRVATRGGKLLASLAARRKSGSWQLPLHCGGKLVASLASEENSEASSFRYVVVGSC